MWGTSTSQKGVTRVKVTIKDIADMAGVSISTVSRVINNSKPVNDEVRKRVLDAMKQTNYRAGMMTQLTGKNDSCLIGAIMPQHINTVVNDYIAGINAVAKIYGYDVMIGMTNEAIESELHYLRRFRDIGAHGIIFAGSEFGAAHADVLGGSGIPCILVGQTSKMSSIPSVHVDNVMASYEAVTYLVQRGHRDIAMIRGSGEMAIGGHRYLGYRQALADAGIPLREERIAESGLAVEDGYDAMRRIMDAGEMPSAVFCATDWMAIGAMNCAMDRGLRVPEDISIFGFDGSYVSTTVRPKLSTVEYSAEEIGMTATRKLLKMIKGEPEVPQHSNVTHRLAIRGSTA